MTALGHSSHPVTVAVASARALLSSVAEAPVWSMDTGQTVATIDDVVALEAQLRQVKSRLLVQAEAVEVSPTMSVPNWLAHRYRLSRPEAHRQGRVAKGLATHPATDTALGDARVNHEQADAILTGLDTLPEWLDQDLKVKAEEHLLELAKDYDAKALKNLARKILEVVAPEEADAHLAKLLERSAAEDEDANRLYAWKTPQGRWRGTFDLDGFSGDCLMKGLRAKAAPKHRASKGPLGERKPTADRLGEAFADYVRRYPATKLPQAGGLNATAVVLMSYDTLMGGLKAAKLDTGEDISPGLARRIACDAAIIPAVLGGKSEVLDLGRTKRFHNKAQRIVATIEQGGCIAEGHDCPPGMSQIHHPTPWSKGGETNRDAWMLCPAAHRRCHDPSYTHQRLPNGKVRFTRRT